MKEKIILDGLIDGTYHDMKAYLNWSKDGNEKYKNVLEGIFYVAAHIRNLIKIQNYSKLIREYQEFIEMVDEVEKELNLPKDN